MFEKKEKKESLFDNNMGNADNIIVCSFKVPMRWYMKPVMRLMTLPETGLSVLAQVIVFASISPLYSAVSCEHKPSLIIKQASLGNSELSCNNGQWQFS